MEAKGWCSLRMWGRSRYSIFPCDGPWASDQIAHQSIRTHVGEVLATSADIQTSAIVFYKDLLSAPSQPMDPIRSNIISRLLTEDDNMTLNRAQTDSQSFSSNIDGILFRRMIIGQYLISLMEVISHEVLLLLPLFCSRLILQIKISNANCISLCTD